MEATCPRHPGAAVVGTCARCGTFLCVEDHKLLGAKSYCADCAARPDVDYLEAFRLKYWGKRDGWAWFFGVGGALNLLLAVGTVVNAASGEGALGRDLVVALVTAGVLTVAGLNGVLFWLGVPLARYGLLLVTALASALQFAVMGPAALLVFAMPLLIAVNVFTNWRTRLFFKLEVSRGTLQRAWDLLHNNTIARQAAIAGVAGLVFPPFAPVALIMGVIGLRRVDPNAWPPIGKKAHAIGGIALGALATLGWGAAAFFAWVWPLLGR